MPKAKTAKREVIILFIIIIFWVFVNFQTIIYSFKIIKINNFNYKGVKMDKLYIVYLYN